MTRSTGNVLALLVFSALGVIYSGTAAAQYFTNTSSGRAGNWEWYGEVRFIFAKDISFGHGTSVSTDDDAGFGLGFGYNIDDHWLASFEFQYNELNYKRPLHRRIHRPRRAPFWVAPLRSAASVAASPTTSSQVR